MILKQSKISEALAGKKDFVDDPLFVVPAPELKPGSGSASIDLRLGRWFLTLKRSQQASFDVTKKLVDEVEFAERRFVPFSQAFILHPGTFALGATLEWIKIPRCLTGIVVGKSSWGRRGLIIETAPTVHPGFAGCLTLELTNVGEIPLLLYPGLRICQLQLARADGAGTGAGAFDGIRRPALGQIGLDQIAEKLRQA